MNGNIRKIFLISAAVLSFLGAIALSLEFYLNARGHSLCKTAACEVVGHYIRIGEPFLITGGAAFFWILGLIFFFTYRYPQKLSSLPVLFLLPALAFDGTLIGFQFFTINQRCAICISVALLLCFISILYLMGRRKYILLLAGILTWTGGFLASGAIEMPEPINAFGSMIFYQRVAPEKGNVQPEKFTLVFSMQCPHCEKVLAYLTKKNPQDVTWQLAATDTDNDSLAELSEFVRQSAGHNNPFSLLKKIKKESGSKNNLKIISKLKKKTKKAQIFLANIGINKIPVLVVELPPNSKTLYIGAPTILRHLESRFQTAPVRYNTPLEKSDDEKILSQ